MEVSENSIVKVQNTKKMAEDSVIVYCNFVQFATF